MLNSNNSYHTFPATRLTIKQAGIHSIKQVLMLAILLLCTQIIIGCGGPEIDASNDLSMHSSIQAIRSALTHERKAEFDRAMIDLNDMLFNQTDAVSQATISLYRPDALLRKILHGKSAREVIDMVEEHRQKLNKK